MYTNITATRTKTWKTNLKKVNYFQNHLQIEKIYFTVDGMYVIAPEILTDNWWPTIDSVNNTVMNPYMIIGIPTVWEGMK